MNLRNIETVIARLNTLANPSPTIGGQPKLSEQTVAEYLRYGLCILANSGEEGPDSMQAVHIGRLLGRVRNQLGPLLPDRGGPRLSELVTAATSKESWERDLCHQVLDRLEVLRDVHKLARGYFLPTPLRLVELRSGNALAIGALPTPEAQKSLGVRLGTAGLARFALRADMTPRLRENADLWQSLANWLGNVPNLGSWIAAYVAAAVKDLKPSASDVGEYRVYCPEASPTRSQFFRWRDSNEWAGHPERLYLCRGTPRNGPAPYWLGLLARDQGDVRVVKEAELESRDDIPRLRYGLDLLSKAPTRATIEAGASEDLLKLSSWLPYQEMRLLQALAVDVSPTPDKLPRHFRFAKRWREDIEGVLHDLGIELRIESSPGS